MLKPWVLWGIGGVAILALALLAGSSLLWSPSPDSDLTSPPAESQAPLDDSSSTPSGDDPSHDSESAASNRQSTEPTSEPSKTSDPDANTDNQTENQDASDASGSGSTDPTETSKASSDSSGTAPGADVIVNGKPIPTSRVDHAFQDLLKRYQESYQEQGRDFRRVLQGPSGSYQELQIRYQAAQAVIEQEIIEQQAAQHGIDLNDSTLQRAFEQRFRSFLNDNSITEDQLTDLYQDRQKRAATQRLLGIDAPSVQALKERLRREARYQLLRQKIAQDVIEIDAELSSEEATQAFSDWMRTQKAESEIIYQDPLLRAHHLEQRISETENLKERQTRVQKTISAYQTAKEQLSIDDAAIDYILGLLYNVRVQVSQAMKDQVLEQSSSGDSSSGGGSRDVDELNQDIQESRRQATQLLSPFNVHDEDQIRRMLKADTGNPLYKYMYARYLYNDSDDQIRARRVIQMLNRALNLAPNYVDALTLFGDLRLEQQYHQQAISYYRRALDAYNTDIEAQLRTVSQDTVRRKLAEAHIAFARSINAEAADEQTSEQRRQSLNQAEELLNGLKDKLSKKDSGYQAVLTGLGDVAMLRGQYEQAQSYYQNARNVDETAEAQVNLGHAYREDEQWEEAEAAYRQALEISSGFASAHEGLARLYKVRNKPDEALAQYQKAFSSGRLSYGERRQIALEALELDADNVDMRLSLGNFYLESNVYQGALVQYQAVLDQSAENVAAHIGIGRVHLERLDYDKALSAFQAALDADPTTGQAIEAHEWIIKAERRKAGPGKPLPESGQEAIWRLAQLYADANQPNESFERLLTLREDYPDFRPDAVQALMEQAKASVGDDLPGQPTPDQGRQLIEPGEDHGPYATTPPTSGPHYVISADWGLHTQQILDEVQVRNLAGGGVLIQYQPTLSYETQSQLRELVTGLRESGTHCRLALAPYDGLSTPIVLTAWRRIDSLKEFDEERIRAFIAAHIEKGPEVGQVGCALPGS